MDCFINLAQIENISALKVLLQYLILQYYLPMRYSRNVEEIHTKCHRLLVEFLKSERKKRGIPQTVLAKQMRLTQNWMSRLEAGQRRISVCEFIQLAKFIGFDPHAILRQLIKTFQPKSASVVSSKISVKAPK